MKKNITLGLIYVLYILLIVISSTLDNVYKRSVVQQGVGIITLSVISQLMTSKANAPLAVAILLVVSVLIRTFAPLPDTVREQWDITSQAFSMVIVSGLVAYEAGGAIFAFITMLITLPIVLTLPTIISQRGVDKKLLEEAAFYAGRAYGFQKVEGATFIYDQKTGTLVGMERKENKVILFFSGTNSMKDFAETNVDVKAVPIPQDVLCKGQGDLLARSRVHKGFLDAYLSVRRQLLTLLTDASLVGNIDSILTTGHSLGGALATLSVLDLCSIFEDIQLVTFGSPQVGNESFGKIVDNFTNVSVRVVTSFDLVPHSTGTIFSHIPSQKVVLPSTPNPIVAHDFPAYDRGIHSDRKIQYTIVVAVVSLTLFMLYVIDTTRQL